MLKILKWTGVGLAAIVAALVGTTAVWYFSADMKPPVQTIDTLDFAVTQHDGYTESHGSMLRRSRNGMWEAWVQGMPEERGAAMGSISRELLYYQEKVFVDQIRRIVPSDGYLRVLRYLLVGFNRNLGAAVEQEFREEIAGIALWCTHEFDAIGTPFERQLNYHAAHDIGHAMQEYMLVGCSSLAAWGAQSADGQLIVGRNFDFWVGDDFARNKVVAFYNPAKGCKFASVTWPGMIGVLSGMNERGLTVTINAAKGAPPTSSATPISLLAREILQYAGTIDEALAIAEKRHTFVNESLLIGSAADGRATVIEKSPRKTALYAPAGEHLICTNHYQSAEFADDKHNIENIATSDSPHRHSRIEELISQAGALDPAATAAILRDRCATGGTPLTPEDPRNVNQRHAHHSVIFKPAELKMWVCGAPGSLGEYVCYDLRTIFTKPDFSHEVITDSLTLL